MLFFCPVLGMTIFMSNFILNSRVVFRQRKCDSHAR